MNQMRTDYQIVIGAIRRAIGMLGQSSQSNGDFGAHLHDLTTIIFEQPLCIDALKAIQHSRSSLPNAFDCQRCVIVRLIKDDLRLFCRSVRGVVEQIQQSAATAPDAGEVLSRALGVLQAKVDFGGQHLELWQILGELDSDDRIDTLSLLELEHIQVWVLAQGWHGASMLIDAHERATSRSYSKSHFENVSEAKKRLAVTLGDAVPFLRLARGLIESASLDSIIAGLNEIHMATRSLIQPSASMPSDYKAFNVLSRLRDDVEGLTAQARRVAHLLEDRLQLGVVAAHSLRRLRVHLERFGKKQLLLDFAEEERRSSDKRQLEARLQERVDAFLFAEGLYPITHAMASGGAVDTFVAENAHVFSDVLVERQIPVLIEIKTVCNGDKTARHSVVEALTLAIQQAGVYAAHLRANPRWSDHRVTALVAYDGKKRYRTREENALLIYLGDAKPHQGAVWLEENS